MSADSIRDLFSAQVVVPSAVVPLDVLPLTANGKVDRKALPAPGRGSDTARVAPRNEAEAELCRMFSDALGHPDVGIDDDFFELGGESLHAARLLGRTRTKFGVEIPINVLFDISTVAGPAAHIDATQSTAA